MDHKTLISTDDRILAARTTLAERMASLEDRVTGTVEDVTGAVSNTAETVRSTAESLTENAKSLFDHSADHVKELLNVSKHVREHPWAGALSATAAGMIAGIILRTRAGTPVTDSRPSAFRDLLAHLRSELVSAGQAAITKASEAIQVNMQALAESATQAVPHHERHARVVPSRNGYLHNGHHATA